MPVLGILGALVGSGFGVAIVNAVVNRKKNQVDISASHVDTALQLRDVAMKDVTSAREESASLRSILKEVEQRLDASDRKIDEAAEFIRIAVRRHEDLLPAPEWVDV
jgi:uncharacterized protein YlxP (DUF503 family)